MAIDKLKTTSLEDNSVTSLKIAPGAVTNDDIPDSEIIADKLHTTLDFSTKTFTMHNNHVTQAMVTQHESALSVTASQVSGLATYLTNNDYNTTTNIVAAITDSAPGTLDTLNELAAALGDDANFSTTVTNSIATKLPLAGGTMTGNLTLGDNVNLYLGDSSDASLVFDGTDTALTSQGELILNGQTGITIDCNNVTNQPTLFLNDMGAGNTGILLRRGQYGGSIMYGYSMDHSRPLAIFGTNKSLGFYVAGSLGDASYAAFDFTIDPNASSQHPAVMGVRSPNNNALLFQGEQSDSTVVFSVDYDGNIATSGTVDGVDIAARDAILTSTTTTANAALPKTGGTITGDVTATTVNATTVDLGDWTITEESGSLLFATQGVTKMKLDPAGNLDVVGNINSSAYIYSAASLVANGKNPALAFDFVNNYYRNGGNDSTFGNSLTFTRASSATMMNSSGQVVTVANGVNRLGHHIYNSASSSWVNSGILIESEARTNYVLDSHLQTTNNGAGTLLTTRTVFTENDVVSPDGTTNAAKLAGDGSNNSHKAVAYMQGSGTFGLTDTVTWSVYLKQGTHRYAQIFITDNAGNTNGTINSFYVNVDLQDGTILGDLAAGAIGTHSRIENVGNGWHRVSATLTKQGDNVRIDGGISFSSAGAAISNPILTAGADDYFYVWGAQAEVGRVVSSLIPTSGGAATRAAELLTVAAAKLPSVVTTPIEVSGTEMLTNPGFDTDTDWYKEAGWTIANGVVTKAAGGASSGMYQTGTFTVTPGKMYKVEIDVTVGQSGSGAVLCQFFGGGGGDTDTSPATSSGYGAGYVGTTSTGTYTWYIIPSINRSKVGLFSTGGWDGTINSFSLKEVEPYAISSHMKGTLNYNDFGIPGAAIFWKRQQYSTTYMNLGLSTQTGRTGQVSGLWRNGGTLPGSSGPNSSYYPGINVPYNISIRHTAAYTQLAIDGSSIAAGNNTSSPHVGMPAQSGINLQIAGYYMGTIDTFTMWGEDIGAAGSESITT